MFGMKNYGNLKNIMKSNEFKFESIKCSRCDGTGYASAARDSGMEDAPDNIKPIGIYKCDDCGGTGKIKIIKR